MRRYNLIRAACAVLVSVAMAASASAEPRGEKDIFDLLMPNQKPITRISMPDPPRHIVASLQDIFQSVEKVDLCTYEVSSGAKSNELLKQYEKVLASQGWERRVIQGPERNFDGVYSRDARSGPFELMLVEIRSNPDHHRVSFTKIAGVKGGGSVTPRAPTLRKEIPRTVSILQITASGPSLQYQSWQQEIVEINRLEPGGQLPMPDIVLQGSTIGFELTSGSVKGRQGFFGMMNRGPSGLDFSIKGPKRLAVTMDSTGSPITVSMDGIDQLKVRATNAPVIITGVPSDSAHVIEVVNQKAVLNLGAMQSGELRVKTTNGDIVATVPASASVEITANAVAGTVAFKAPGAQANGKATENAATKTKMSVGSGRGKLILESISGNITATVK